MNNDLYKMSLMQNIQPLQYTVQTEPYFINKLRELVGKSVIIETTRGNLQGILVDVEIDHVVVKSYDGDTIFYIRLQKIVHVMPT